MYVELLYKTLGTCVLGLTFTYAIRLNLYWPIKFTLYFITLYDWLNSFVIVMIDDLVYDPAIREPVGLVYVYHV